MAFANGSGLDDEDEDDYSDAHTITPPPASRDLPVTVTSQDTVGYDYNNSQTAGLGDARGKPTYISIPFSNNSYVVGPQQSSDLYQQQLLQQQYAQSITQTLNSQYLQQQQPSRALPGTYPTGQYEYQQPHHTTPAKKSTAEPEQEEQTERTVYYNPTQSPSNSNVSTVRPKLTVQIPMDEEEANKGGKKIKDEEIEKKESVGPEDQEPVTSQSLPTTTATTTAGTLTGTWGTQMLPPPSPSAYLVSSTSAGPINPFSRSLLSASIAASTGNETSLSSRYVSDMLPSPSNFYNTDWPSFSTQPTTTTTATTTFTSTLGPSSALSTTASFSNLRSQLSFDMVPSPLQFNTPVVMASTANSFMDSSSASAGYGDKRDAAYECGGSGMESVKRIKLEGRC